jgi:L-amino acid N-acyltransferase YncA
MAASLVDTGGGRATKGARAHDDAGVAMTKTTSVRIRRAESSDVPAITEIYNEAIVETTATFDIEPKTLTDRNDWLQAHNERHPVVVAEVDGKVVGWAALTPWSDRAAYDDTAETAFYVHSSFRDRGIGRRLNSEIVDLAKRLGFHTLIARMTEDSAASIHLNEAAGFVHIGTMREVGRKFGRLLDVHMMQKMLADG